MHDSGDIADIDAGGGFSLQVHGLFRWRWLLSIAVGVAQEMIYSRESLTLASRQVPGTKTSVYTVPLGVSTKETGSCLVLRIEVRNT